MSIEETAPFTGLVDGQPITEAEAEGWIPRTCFKHGPPSRIGLELEFPIHQLVDDGAPDRHLDPERLQRLHEDLDSQPLHSRFTVEPGGQVELSSLPADDLPTVIEALEGDLSLFNASLNKHSARLVGVGLDPLPPPPRHLYGSRYDAMEAYFDRWGSAGRAMMRASASVQVNVEAGRLGHGPDDLRRRWDLLHAVGPALVSAFSNSSSYPATDQAWAGFSNLRAGIWQTLDPDRCRQPQIAPGESLPDAWTRWALDAPVMAVRREHQAWTAPSGLSFRRWLREGTRAVPDAGLPTLSDLQYHLTTLFPPVRARGHLELRYIDAQPGRWWRVPAATISALLDDDSAADAVLAANEPVAGRWQGAARLGLADPELHRAAESTLTTAAEALERAGRTELAELTSAYLDRRLAGPHSLDTEERPC